MPRGFAPRMGANTISSGTEVVQGRTGYGADGCKNWTAVSRPERLRREGEPQGRGGNRRTSSGHSPRRAGVPRKARPGLSSAAGQRSTERGEHNSAGSGIADSFPGVRPNGPAFGCPKLLLAILWTRLNTLNQAKPVSLSLRSVGLVAFCSAVSSPISPLR